MCSVSCASMKAHASRSTGSQCVLLRWRVEPIASSKCRPMTLATRSIMPSAKSSMRRRLQSTTGLANKQVEEGIVPYVKASVTGDEADYVLDYERRYPDFPRRRSTADLFFSEEQMEAYRALGFHAMSRALDGEASRVPRYGKDDAGPWDLSSQS